MKNKDATGRKEVEYKTKSGTAWSHSYLNQKPWHPLSYPNQRRKWIAEQTHAERQRKSEDVAREFAQEQDFFRTSSMLSKKEREKLEAMQAVSFMYMRPPGYNPESARAAEIADEKKSETADLEHETISSNDIANEKRKPRQKDLYGKAIPTEEEFPVLKNAPRLESGATARVKPFAVEIRNVKCARCGGFGHQSGDRECPLKDSITAIDEARQKRDDPLTSIMHAVSNEPLKWELKNKPGGLSPPRGGFKRDDPNQQIIPEDDIFDEYGGFLSGGAEFQELLASLPEKKHKKENRKRNKHRKTYSSDSKSENDSENEMQKKKKKRKHRHRKESFSSDNKDETDNPNDSEDKRRRRKHRERKASPCSESKSETDSENEFESKKRRRKYRERRKRKDGKKSKKDRRHYHSNVSSESDSYSS